MAHETQQELSNNLNRGANKAGNVAKQGVSRLSKMTVKGAKALAKGAKDMAKNGVKATLKASKIVALFSSPLGWILLAVIALLIIFIAVDAHDPATTRNYNEDYVRHSRSVPEKVIINYEAEHEGEFFLDSELTEYFGDGYIGRTCKQYMEYFDEMFRYVFEELCRMEVERVIDERGYDYDDTMASYEECEDPFLNLNYAEIICVMSQNPDFSLYEGSLTEIMEYLGESNQEQLKYLYYMTVLEKLGTRTENWSETKTYSEEEYPYSSKVVGSVVNDEKIFVNLKGTGASSFSSWFNSKFASASQAELKEYIAKEGSGEFREEHGFVTNGRTVITPLTTDKPSWTFVTTLTDVTTKEEEEVGDLVLTRTEFNEQYKNASDRRKNGLSDNQYEYEPSTGRVKDKKTGKYVENTEVNVKTYYTCETHLIRTYLYGEIALYPYALSDLYKCFNIEFDDYNIDHPAIQNITLLDEQEYFLRNYIEEGEEGFLGSNTERTPLYSAFDMLMQNNISEYNIELLALMSELDLTDFQGNVWELSSALEGIPYGAKYGGFNQFVCCTYAWYLMHNCGVDICPKNMPAEEAQKMGLNPNTDIRNSCTLQCHYFDTYQPQAVLGSTYNEGLLEAGDLIYIQYDKNARCSYNVPQSEVTDHVYVYLGNGIISEQAGGSLNKVTTRKIDQKYIDSTYKVVRPSLIDNGG